MMLSMSHCDHSAIIYRNPPEEVLASALVTPRHPEGIYVLEYDSEAGLTAFALDHYAANDGS